MAAFSSLSGFASGGVAQSRELGIGIVDPRRLHPSGHSNFIGAALTGSDAAKTLNATDEAPAALNKQLATLGPVEQLKARLASRR